MKNKPKIFQKSKPFETELANSHKIALIVLKVSFKKQKSRVLNYLNFVLIYKFYSNNILQEQFLTKPNYDHVSTQNISFKGFQETRVIFLNSVVSRK